MIVNWGHAWPSITAAFLASLVEFVEALTVVLAVGTVRGWRGALIGSGAAVVALLAILKSGAAYLPLDPAYPSGRIEALLRDARPSLVLASRDAAARLPESPCPILLLE